MTNLLVTGPYRCGTTAVDKLLHAHPDVAVASQPFPHLALEVMRRWRTARGLDAALPFSPLIGEERPSEAELARFLDTEVVTAPEVKALAEAARGWSGQRTPALWDVVDEIRSGTLAQLMARVQRLVGDRLAEMEGRGPPTVVGSKEILCEELAPWWCGNGHVAVVVVRDPRTMLASLSGPGAARFAGTPRPTLLHLRVWRRAVAFGLAAEATGRGRLIRFEDVVADPAVALGGPLTPLLRVAPDGWSVSVEGVADQGGGQWSANTSFSTALDPAAALDRATSVLEPDVIAYADALTGPERRLLEYPDVAPPSSGFDRARLAAFVEPSPVGADRADPDLSTSARSLDVEMERHVLLSNRSGPVDDSTARRLLLHPAALGPLRTGRRSSDA